MAIDTTYLDSDTDNVMLARPAILAMANKLNLVIDIMSEGAVGDGTTDDTAAIQSAVDKINAAGGGTLIIPSPYVFAMSDVGGIARPVGAGAGPVPVGTPTAKFTFSNLSNITIKGGGRLKLLRTASGSGTYDAYNWHFFQFNTCNRIRIKDVEFEGNRTIPIANINYNGEQGEVFRFNACTDVRVVDCYFTLVSISSLRIMAGSKKFRVRGNTAYDCNDCFVQVGDDASPDVASDPRDIIISKNIIDQFYTDAGIKVRYSAHNVLIDRNIITAYQGGLTQNPPALMIRGKSDADDRVTDIKVTNNILSASVTAVSMSDSFASSGRYPKNVTFSGNEMKGSATLKGSKIKFTHNDVQGAVSQILAADVFIKYNHITYTGTDAQRAVDIGVAGDYKAHLIGNEISSSGTGHTIYIENVTRVKVDGNDINKTGTTTGTNNQLEAYIPADGDWTINGNTFYQAPSYRLGGCLRINGQGANSMVTIANSTFRNAGAYSIRRSAGLAGSGVVVGCTSVGATTGNYLDSTTGSPLIKTGCTF